MVVTVGVKGRLPVKNMIETTSNQVEQKGGKEDVQEREKVKGESRNNKLSITGLIGKPQALKLGQGGIE